MYTVELTFKSVLSRLNYRTHLCLPFKALISLTWPLGCEEVNRRQVKQHTCYTRSSDKVVFVSFQVSKSRIRIMSKWYTHFFFHLISYADKSTPCINPSSSDRQFEVGSLLLPISFTIDFWHSSRIHRGLPLAWLPLFFEAKWCVCT